VAMQPPGGSASLVERMAKSITRDKRL
jgi:hypothetical protein